MTEDLLKKLLETNNEILKWIRFSNIEKVKETLEKTLDSPKKLIAYSMSDGINTSTYVSEKADTGQMTISRWWRDWSQLGIVSSISARGGSRAKKIFELEDYGISVPTLPSRPKEQTENNEIIEIIPESPGE